MASAKIRLAGTGLVALALAGCYISETPLLTAENARARPLTDGVWRICEVETGVSGENCVTAEVSRGAERETRIVDENGDTSILRFRRAGRNAWIASPHEGEDDSFIYLAAFRQNGDVVLALMDCGSTPKNILDPLVARGDIVLDNERGDSDVCLPQSADAMAPVARAYRDGEIVAAATSVFSRMK